MEEAVAALSDAQLREPSRLPGWTRGHVVAHVSRNAGGVFRVAHAVNTGEPDDMYPGGLEARASMIEEGASRPSNLAAADFQWSGRRVVSELRAVPSDRENMPTPWQMMLPVAMAPGLRLIEIEVHRVDLDLGYTPEQWPTEMVVPLLAMELAHLPERAPGVTAPELPDHQMLAWLLCRSDLPWLPELPPWH
jgi:maleylpyruvate isomerase